MMRRRYEIKAVFDDSDYGDLQVGPTKRYWSISTAKTVWFNKEKSRKNVMKNGVQSWHFILFDHKTGKDITPNLTDDIFLL